MRSHADDDKNGEVIEATRTARDKCDPGLDNDKGLRSANDHRALSDLDGHTGAMSLSGKPNVPEVCEFVEPSKEATSTHAESRCELSAASVQIDRINRLQAEPRSESRSRKFCERFINGDRIHMQIVPGATWIVKLAGMK